MINEQPSDSLAKWIVCSQIIAATFLQKIALPFGPPRQIFLALLIMIAASAVGLLSQRLEFRKTRLALYLLMAGALSLLQLINGHDFSRASLALMLVIHLPYVMGLKSGISVAGFELTFFRKVMMTLAALGILQFGLQFVVGYKLAFFLDTAFPKEWIMAGYNGLIPLHIGDNVYKSNGFFLLEPSTFSQFLALALIIEMVCFKRAAALLLYSVALLTTFSGTGLSMLACIVPFYLLRQRNYAVIASLMAGLALLIATAPYVGLEDYFVRIHEFSNTGASGYARFVSMFPTIRDFLLPHADTLFFGLGAGSLRSLAGHVSYAAHDPSWGKVLMEYGITGALAYFPLMLHVFLTSPKSAYIRSALLIQFLFLSEYVLSPTLHNVIIALLAWPAERREERHA